jgi:hypothetical protein
MSTIGLRAGAKPEGRVSAKAVRLAALLGALLLASLTVNALTIVADGKRRQSMSSTVECQAIAARMQRLDCRDKLAQKPAPTPFEGANALGSLGSL